MSDRIAEFRADRDAFGHMLLDQFNGEQPIEIIEREHGLVLAAGECRRYFAEYPDWNPMEQEAMRWLVPGRALDLGCGAGRVALYLQEQGYEVMGIDERGRMAGQIRMRVRYRVHRSEWSDYLMVSRDEMQELLQGTEWRVVRFLDSAGPAYAAILEKVDRAG